MAYTVKIIITQIRGFDDAQLSAHQTAVRNYLDGATITTIHSITTVLHGGHYVTTIVYE